MLDTSIAESSPSRNRAQRDGGYVYFFPNKELIAQSEGNMFPWDPEQAHDDAGSGGSTPSLWSNSGSPTPDSSPRAIGSLSPNSRVQAIAKGQRELMEFVRRMPENCYELSLKDMVEIPSAPEENPEWPVVIDPRQAEKGETKSDTESRVAKTRRSSYESRGLFLNFFLPASIRSKKRTLRGMNSKFNERASPVSLPDVLSPESVSSGWWMEGTDRFGDGYKNGDSRNARRINKSWYMGVSRRFCFLSKREKMVA